MPFDTTFSRSNFAYSNEDRTATCSTGQWASCILLGAIPPGEKVYYEIDVYFEAGLPHLMIGLQSDPPAEDEYPGSESDSYGYYSYTGKKYNDMTGESYGDAYANVVVGIFIDSAAKKIWYALDNVWQASGDPASGTGEAFADMTATILSIGVDGAVQLTVNETEAQFVYSPPSPAPEFIGATVFIAGSGLITDDTPRLAGRAAVRIAGSGGMSIDPFVNGSSAIIIAGAGTAISDHYKMTGKVAVCIAGSGELVSDTRITGRASVVIAGAGTMWKDVMVMGSAAIIVAARGSILGPQNINGIGCVIIAGKGTVATQSTTECPLQTFNNINWF